MKPLICLLAIALTVSTASIAAQRACKDAEPNAHHRTLHRQHYVKINYANPVIYCDYHDDDRGQLYTTCYERTPSKCTKEYFYENDRNHDC